MELSNIGITEFTKEEMMGGMDRHHIVFRSHGGVNHRYNLISMPHGFHIGDRGPHRNRELDLKLKRMQQEQLFRIFGEKKLYTMDAIFSLIHPETKKDKKAIERMLRWKTAGWLEGKKINEHKSEADTALYEGETIVRELMGGHLF